MVTLAAAVDGARDAPPLVLLHSIGADRTMWAPQVSELGDELRLVRPEARGHGDSAAPPGPYTLADLGGDVLDTADAVGLDDFHLAGVSLGGITALWVAVHASDRVLTLTVANTAARIGSREGWDERIAAVEQLGMAGLSDAVMERFFSPSFRQTEPAVVARTARAFRAVSPSGYIGCCAALGHADLRDDVRAITAPTVIVGGTADVSTPPDEQRRLHETIAGSELVVLDGAGHLSNLERPTRFSALLRAQVAAHR